MIRPPTATISLTNDRTAIIDIGDLALVSEHKWQFTQRYASTRHWDKATKKPSKATKMQNLIMQPPKGMIVDHINGDTLDNRRSNLRICTQHQNNFNRRKVKGTSQYKGVCLVNVWKDKFKWCASIKHNKKAFYIGTYEKEIDAAKAYDAQATKLFGEFAQLNFPLTNYRNAGGKWA